MFQSIQHWSEVESASNRIFPMRHKGLTISHKFPSQIYKPRFKSKNQTEEGPIQTLDERNFLYIFIAMTAT